MILPLGPPMISPCFCRRLGGRSRPGLAFWQTFLGNPSSPLVACVGVFEFILVVDLVVAGIIIVAVTVAVFILIHHCNRD